MYMERKHNDRYKKMDTKEVDSFLQSELDKAASKAKKEKLELNQKTLLDLLNDQTTTKEIKESKEATKKLEHQFDLLQEDQLHLHQQIQQRRTSSATSSPISKPSSVISSPHTLSPHMLSPHTSPSSPQSTCPICHKTSTYETIVTWKDCQHAMVSIPYFSL
jgi:hypothetical protein